VIRSFRHCGLQATRRVASDHIAKLRDILAVLDRGSAPEDMRLPGFRLYALTADRRGHWAVSVSDNWRVTFRFADGDVDHVDYH
jgi:toxin HigB-1